MARETLENLIGISESTKVEWKQSLSEINEIIETIAAFSNAKGGKVFIGVTNTGEAIGVQVVKGTLEELANRIAQNTDPKIQPRIVVEKAKGKNIIVIDVNESLDKLVLAFGRPFKRVGNCSVKMCKDEYERLILEKHKDRVRFDNHIIEGVTLKDIDREKVKAFVIKAKTERGLDINENLSSKEILMRLKLVRNGKLTNAAVLLFGKPQDFFLQSAVKCVRFKGLDVTDKMIDLKLINGNIIEQVIEVEKFIFDHISMSAWIESGKIERQEKWEYPPKVIRESLANAIAHRDYWSVSKIQVRIFDDRIEFWNPGNLPEGWTVETLKQKHDSVPPNPLIAEQFFWIKYIEEVGTGTNKIIQWCKEWGLPDPDFEYAGTSLVVTIRKSKLTEEYILTLNLNDRQKKAIEFLRKNKKITSKEYSELFGATTRTARNDLSDMVGKRVIKRIGESDKKAYYILAEI